MSLVTTPSSKLATCTACSGTRVTRISMTLTDGSEVDFTSCHTCEHKSWAQAGSGLAVTEVLKRAQKVKKAA